MSNAEHLKVWILDRRKSRGYGLEKVALIPELLVQHTHGALPGPGLISLNFRCLPLYRWREIEGISHILEATLQDYPVALYCFSSVISYYLCAGVTELFCIDSS